MNRRRFLTLAAGAAALPLVPLPAILPTPNIWIWSGLQILAQRERAMRENRVIITANQQPRG